MHEPVSSGNSSEFHTVTSDEKGAFPIFSCISNGLDIVTLSNRLHGTMSIKVLRNKCIQWRDQVVFQISETYLIQHRCSGQ